MPRKIDIRCASLTPDQRATMLALVEQDQRLSRGWRVVDAVVGVVVVVVAGWVALVILTPLLP